MTNVEIKLFLRSKFPNDVSNMIEQKIIENAANTIISVWRENVLALNIALVEFCSQTNYYPLSQKDINLIFALNKAIKNRTIKLDYIFWLKLLMNMYIGLVSSREVVIDNVKYSDINFLLFYGKIIKKLITCLQNKSE